MRTSIFLILVAFTLSLFGQGNTIDWRDGRPGVRVVTNSLQTGEIMGLIDVAGQAKAGTGDVARIEGELVTHTDDAAIHLTSNQVVRIAQEHGGGITAEVDPVAGPRLDLIEPETNKWNAAYGWGDHALAGYLTNETDAIALAVMATNRTTVVFNPTNSNEFTDGAMRVWRIDTVTNTFIGWSVVIETPISICGEVIQPSTNQWPGIPYPLWTDSALSFTQFITNYPAGSTQPMVVWYYYRTGSASPHEVYFSSPAEESSASWHSTYGSSSAGASPRDLLGQDDGSPTWSSWVSMIYGTNTTVSVVTSQVATVAWQSDLTPYAAHIHRTDNPHGVTAPQIGALTAEQDLAALRTYHYGSPDIVESPAEWFGFDGSGTITAFNWAEGRENVVIPWEIGGVPVTAIGGGAFEGSGIVSVIAPQTVTVIGDNAFNSCYSLASVSLPQATAIGGGAFYSCPSLTSVSLPQATSIGGYAFADCSLLASVRMGQNAPAEATGVFAYITPPPTVYVTNPQATGWGDTWNGAPVVRPNLYGSNVTAQAFTLGSDTITEWPVGGATNITDGVTSGTYSEATRTLNISNLLAGVSVELPDGIVTNEQDLAALRTYHYGSPDIVESPAEWFAFDGAGTITAFNWEAGRTNVVIPWAIGGVPVTAIGTEAFFDPGAYLGFPVTSVIAPQTVTAIGNYAFAYCDTLASVSLPQATSIGDYAFYSCGSLASVSLPQATSIGDSAFVFCTSLTSVNLPQATSIGNYAFDSCASLTSVNLPQATSIGDSAFYNCDTLASVSLPQATTIGNYAFGYCDTLASVSLPQATTIGDGAFAGCYTLTPVTIPQTTSIGDSAFEFCTSLTSVHMGRNAPAEAAGVFYGITPPPTVYVTDPQATGWGAEWNGAPVVRPPLYGSNVTAQAFTLNGDTITEWPRGGGSVPYTDWTGTVTPQNGTATVTYAHGNMPVLVTDAPCVLTLDPTGYGTAGVSRVSLSYYTGTNSFTFATNVITYSATPTVDTNGWNSLLIRRVSDGAWKGVGL